MDFTTSLFLNINFIVFPLTLCLISISYKQKLDEKENMIFLDLSLLTICYLLCNLVEKGSFLSLYLLNIPLILAYRKKRNIVAVMISVLLINYYNNMFNIHLIYFIIEYSVYFIIYELLKNKAEVIDYITISLLKSIILSYLLINDSYKSIFNLGLNSIIFIFTTILTLYLFEKTEENLIFKKKFIEMEKEKEVLNSLFQITHEIKNPITVCKGYLDMFDVENKEHAIKYIPKMKSEIERVLVLLEDFLSIRKLKVNKDVMDINMLVEDIIDDFKDILKEKNIKNQINILDEEIYIDGDYNRLSQVLINVIKNSIESMNKNDNLIKINTKSIDHNIIITIEDNGKGMSEENLKNLFKPFFTTKTTGNGLGLYLSNEIIKKHNGNMHYDSKENVGTKLTITLPIKKDIKIS